MSEIYRTAADMLEKLSKRQTTVRALAFHEEGKGNGKDQVGGSKGNKAVFALVCECLKCEPLSPN
jgi:hypothetical protein